MTQEEDTGPRIAPLPEAEARALAKQVGVPSSMAGVNAFRVLLRHPDLAAAVSGLLSMLLFKANKLDERLRELIIMRIAWRTGSEYEWTQHWRVACHIGLAEADILAVRDPDNAPQLSEADCAVLAATDDILDRGKISAGSWARCAAQIGDERQMLELVIAICNWRMFSELLRSVQIPLEDGVTGWPPDGLASPAAE